MFYFSLFVILSVGICGALLAINFFISMVKFKNFEKKTPFECGFMPISSSCLPFSLPFYLMILMFLIFDIEVILLIPIVIYVPYLNSMAVYVSSLMLMVFMLATLLYEISSNYLKWIY